MQRKIKMKESPKNKLAVNFVCALEPLTHKASKVRFQDGIPK